MIILTPKRNLPQRVLTPQLPLLGKIKGLSRVGPKKTLHLLKINFDLQKTAGIEKMIKGAQDPHRLYTIALLLTITMAITNILPSTRLKNTSL